MIGSPGIARNTPLAVSVVVIDDEPPARVLDGRTSGNRDVGGGRSRSLSSTANGPSSAMRRPHLSESPHTKVGVDRHRSESETRERIATIEKLAMRNDEESRLRDHVEATGDVNG